MTQNRVSKKLVGVALASIVLICAAAGCGSGASSSQTTATSTVMRDASGGTITITIPPGWHRVPLVGLPGANVPLEVASFRPRGAVRTICDPHSIVQQIPTGGALLQILDDGGPGLPRRHGPGAVGEPSTLSPFKPLAKPFRLGALRGHECGEAYNVTFRGGRRVFQLRIWTTPAGLRQSVRHQVEDLMDGLRVGRYYSGPLNVRHTW